MPNSKIIYYPVENGDTTLIKLTDNKTILIDCKLRKSSENDNDNQKFDVKEDILKRVEKKSDGKPFVDSFILSHPDQDHCLGFENNFYTGDPSSYSQKHLKDKMIFVDELWFSPKIIKRFTSNSELCDDAKAFKKEAERRLEMHKSKHSERNNPGNRIIVIGYNDNPDLADLDDSLRFIPGDEVEIINSEELTTFSFFVHAPFKKDIGKSANDRKSSSLVLQARFKNDQGEFLSLAMFGGDADHYIWEKILIKSKEEGNNNALKWDLFQTPHHCSWTFFNDTKYEDNKEPRDTSLEIISTDNQLEGAKIIASCKAIEENDDNPPHYPAKKEYLSVLSTTSDFIVTGEYPSEKAPKPLIFEISKNGPVKQPQTEGSTLASAGGLAGSINKPATQG